MGHLVLHDYSQQMWDVPVVQAALLDVMVQPVTQHRDFKFGGEPAYNPDILVFFHDCVDYCVDSYF